MTVVCAKCKYFRPGIPYDTGFVKSQTDPTCNHPDCVDLVYGNRLHCETARAFPCGQSGLFFDRKDDLK